MPKEMLIRFAKEDVAVRAVLLDDQAPRTCEVVWRSLPLSGYGSHAAYSGTVAALQMDPSIGANLEEENATTCVQTGDVMFTHYRPGFRHGHPQPVSEIYWAYDRYARPTIPGQWVPATANVFGRIVGDATAFYEMCRRIRREGWKPLEIIALS